MKLVSCLLCNSRIAIQSSICDRCYDLLPWNISCCSQCGKVLSFSHSSTTCCAACFVRPRESLIFAAFIYIEPISDIIHSFKYHANFEFVKFLAASMLEYRCSKPGFSLPDIIIPVPLHKNRLRSRGFNQAWELVKVLGDLLRVPVAHNYVLRLKNTKSQLLCKREERLANVRNAFSAVNKLENKKVLVVDDVVTTGATIFSVEKELRRIGCFSVEFWAVARGK